MANNNFSDFFSGFGFEKIIRCCPLLSQTHCNVISAMGNLAASTDLYMFKNSYPYIARMTNTSEGTVRRAIAAAIKSGILVKTRTYDSARMNGSNRYHFSTSFLEMAKQIAIACKEKSVSIFNESPRLRSIAKMFFSGLSCQQLRSDHPDQSRSDQGDRTKEKKTKPSDKRIKRPCTKTPAASPAVDKIKMVQPEGNPAVAENVVFAEMAAAKARSDKHRSDKRHSAQKLIHEQAEKLAKKFAWLKGAPSRQARTSHDPMAIGDFSGMPSSCTIHEAMEFAKKRGMRSELEEMEWSIPPGFRGSKG
ncbi:hypothetical protein [Enterobacter hormaechei]|uniref:hypothetical protein n=1 Tax=Enterobacter hormaechei TaxID=158836 RepID=UPI00115DBD6A|nr:hypothetical protein [Enterobacter hormaechei]